MCWKSLFLRDSGGKGVTTLVSLPLHNLKQGHYMFNAKMSSQRIKNNNNSKKLPATFFGCGLAFSQPQGESGISIESTYLGCQLDSQVACLQPSEISELA